MIPVLLTTDGSPSSLRAAAYAAEYVAGLPGIAITIATVLRPDDPPARAEQILAGTVAAMHPQPPQLRTAVLNGVPATAICDFARRLGARMIIVGTRGESLQKLLLGSVSRTILESAPCPVLVVP